MAKQPAEVLSEFISIEQKIRQADSVAALGFVVTNLPRSFLSYAQAIFWRRTGAGDIVALGASGGIVINRESPAVIRLQKALASLLKEDKPFSSGQRPESLSEWFPAHYMLMHNDKAGMIVFRNLAFQADEKARLQLLQQTFVHAVNALLNQRQPLIIKQFPITKKFVMTTAAVLVAVSLLPVRQTTVAPAEVISTHSRIVTAPSAGVIKDLLVQPNQIVKRGQLLYTLDQTDLINQVKVAQKRLSAASEQVRKASLQVLHSGEAREQLAALKIMLNKAQQEYGYQQKLLAKTRVVAPQAGVVIFSDTDDLLGRPVQQGQSVLEIAAPNQKRVSVWLPIDNLIETPEHADIKLTFNNTPFTHYQARLATMNYRALSDPQHGLSYKIRADFKINRDLPRIGVQGTAKIYGNKVSLFYALFNKPINYVRRVVGV